MALDASDVISHDVNDPQLGSVIITEVYYDTYKREDMDARYTNMEPRFDRICLTLLDCMEIVQVDTRRLP